MTPSKGAKTIIIRCDGGHFTDQEDADTVFDGPLFEPKQNKNLREGDPGYSIYLDRQKKKLENQIQVLEKQCEDVHEKMKKESSSSDENCSKGSQRLQKKKILVKLETKIKREQLSSSSVSSKSSSSSSQSRSSAIDVKSTRKKIRREENDVRSESSYLYCKSRKT